MISAFFGAGVGDELKVIFIEYLHRHLHKYATDIRRERRYVCPHCTTPVDNLKLVRKKLAEGKAHILCQACEEKVPLRDIIEQRLGSDPVARKVLEMDQRADGELDSLALEQILTGHCLAVCGEASQIYRPGGMPDLGIHGEIEFRKDNGELSGKKIYIHLWFYGATMKTQSAWWKLPHPIFVVYRDNDQITWRKVDNPFSLKGIISFSYPLNAKEIWRMRDKMLR